MRSVRDALSKNDSTTLNRYGRFLEPIFARMGMQASNDGELSVGGACSSMAVTAVGK